MMILVGMMSIAGVLAFSGGIVGLDILGSTEEDAADQATPPTDVGEDKGTDPDTDTVISGGNYVDHISGSAEDDLVYLDADDDFYDGK
jgi:hypothetical protein